MRAQRGRECGLGRGEYRGRCLGAKKGRDIDNVQMAGPDECLYVVLCIGQTVLCPHALPELLRETPFKKIQVCMCLSRSLSAAQGPCFMLLFMDLCACVCVICPCACVRVLVESLVMRWRTLHPIVSHPRTSSQTTHVHNWRPILVFMHCFICVSIVCQAILLATT